MIQNFSDVNFYFEKKKIIEEAFVELELTFFLPEIL